MHTKFWSENLEGRGQAEDVGEDRKIILKCVVWTGCIWIRIGASGGLVRTRQ
jgi:hypothetical protein